MLLRVLSVTGWSRPSTRSWSGSSAAKSRSAARVAHLGGPGRDVVAGPERLGVVAAQHPLLVRQQCGEELQRPARVAGLGGPVRDIVAGPERVGVVAAQHGVVTTFVGKPAI